MKIRLILLGALLIPAVASAQPDLAASDLPAAPLTVSATVAADPAPAPVQTRYATTAPEYREVTDSYDAPMFTTGALVFGASYGTSVIVAAWTGTDRGKGRLYVPVLGPWLALHDRGTCDILKSSCDHETTAKVLLVANGVFQAAGIVGMIDSVLFPPTHRVVTRAAKLDTKLHVRPTLIHGGPGIKVFGRF